MKVITVKQPWASLMFINNDYQPKDIENRMWKTNFRGRILIHAGKSILRPQKCNLTDAQWDNIHGNMRHKILHSDLPTSCILGSVEIVDCAINHPSIWAEKTKIYDGSDPGPSYLEYHTTYNWVLANPEKLACPIQAKGKLSFWEYPMTEEEYFNLEKISL